MLERSPTPPELTELSKALALPRQSEQKHTKISNRRRYTLHINSVNMPGFQLSFSSRIMWIWLAGPQMSWKRERDEQTQNEITCCGGTGNGLQPEKAQTHLLHYPRKSCWWRVR
jgi:hypothetical protein